MGASSASDALCGGQTTGIRTTARHASAASAHSTTTAGCARRAGIACASRLPMPRVIPRARARCIQNHSSRANRSPVRLHPLPPHLPTPRSPHATPPPPVPVSFPTGLRPVHRGRRLRRQHGVLQNSHHDGRPWLRHVRLVHGSLERPLRELPAPPSRLASTSAPEASMAACTSGGRESSPVLVHPQDTLCTVHSALAPRTAPRTLSRTGGRLADGRSFGAVGGKHKQGPAGGGRTRVRRRSPVSSRAVATVARAMTD